mmetsp:Transcript_17432/g.59214  ORF Transcript_17432/g.59214 Transcript_17432/m.59214 type:complete len:242 (-) Transcript_17432:24-749(-)
MSLSVVYSSLVASSYAASSSLMRSSVRNAVTMGVLTVRAMLRISLRRGTPSVTFLALIPAWWKVLSVICVAGSPTDCAASTPHISPGCTMERWNSVATCSHTQCSASSVRRCLSTTARLDSFCRTRAWNSSVAFCCASRERGSSPGTTTSLSVMSSCTIWSARRGCRSVGRSSRTRNLRLAFQMRRSRLTGRYSVLSEYVPRCRCTSRSSSRSRSRRAFSSSSRAASSPSLLHSAIISGVR